jgi:hypothetical protein
VLEVRGGARRGAKCRWIERASARGQEQEARETAADLELTRPEVLMRQSVTREVEDRPEQERREPRPAGGARRGARRHVQYDDHGCLLSDLGPVSRLRTRLDPHGKLPVV